MHVQIPTYINKFENLKATAYIAACKNF